MSGGSGQGSVREALVKVKTSLCALVLWAPDFQKPFMLAVDSCDLGVGAVLLQAGFERPVAYFKKAEETSEDILLSSEA